MINSGTENSRPRREGPLVRPKLFPLPHAVRSGSTVSQPQQQGWQLLSPGNEAVDGHRLSQEPEGMSQSNGLNEPWVSLHPSHAALLMGTAHSPHVGLQVALPPKNLWVVQWVWAQNQPLQEWGSTHEYWGDAGDAPAAPSTRFLQLVFPAPTCAEPRVAYTITQLY